MHDDEPIWPSWDGGSNECETCGINFDRAEFYIDEDGYKMRLSLGCYSGESFDSTDWAAVEAWLKRWKHLENWDRFTAEVMAHKPVSP